MLQIALVLIGIIIGFIIGGKLLRTRKPPKKQTSETKEKPAAPPETAVPRPVAQSKFDEPLAIIGIGCRFPKSPTKNKFWDTLTKGINGIVKIPKDRWDADLWHDSDVNRRSRMTVNKGGFLEDVDKFDAQFFGLSGHEAHRMDPQHKFLLEVVYHAFQDAGLTLDEHITGKNVGCFIGISCHDYNEIETQQVERVNLTGHTITGISQSIASNRISYVFDMRGPSFSVDTACSSTLMALNEAFFNINHGLCDIAIVGGVNLLLRPETTICFSKGGFLSPDCQCKSFDEAANGYIRSEGVGVVILKPLKDSVRDKNRIYSTVLGTTLNHDGKTNGMSLPSQEAQERLMKETYERIGLDPRNIQFIEAHGTGTRVGDPIEANAIGNIISKRRKKGDNLLIGSVKANIGHCEPASAIAGLIKLSLAMKNRVIPKNILLNNPNPKIKWEKLRLKVPTENVEWKGEDIYGAISSFGFGGANGHAVLKMSNKYVQPETKAMGEGDGDGLYLFCLSARSEESLKMYCESFMEMCKTSPLHIRDVCYTANIKRDHFKFRMTCIVSDKDDLYDKLDTYLKEDNVLGLTVNRVLRKTQPKFCFVYSGQGPQYFEMGRQLIKESPIFRLHIEKCDEELRKYTDWSLMEELLKSKEESRINETRIAQPAIFSIQYALTHLWVKKMGVIPRAVVGHSIGEVAAAWASGNILFEDAIKVIYHRSKTQDRASGKGKMLAVAATLEQAQDMCKPYAGKIGVATINGPNLAVLSGDNEPIEQLANELSEKDIFNRVLRVTVPFHSHHMDPLEKELLEDLKDLKFQKRHTTQYSTVTGDVIASNCDNRYWFQNVRQTVMFAQAANNIVKDGFSVFVEISNHPILSKYVEEVMQKNEVEGIIVASIKRKSKELLTIMDNFAKLHCFGVEVPLTTITPEGNFVDLPLYPFQKTRYWMESESGRKSRLRPFEFHPLLKEHVVSVKNENDHYFKIDLDTRTHPFIAHHIVQGECIYPGAGLSELAMACAIDAYGMENFQFLRDLRFEKAVYLPIDDYCPDIQFNLNNFDGEFRIFSKKGDQWTEHCSGKIDHLKGSIFNAEKIDMPKMRERVKDEKWKSVEIEGMYKRLYESGLMLGPSFQGIKKLWTNSQEINGIYSGSTVSYIESDPCVKDDIDHFLIHPGMLDSAFQSMFGIMFGDGKNTGVYIPIKIDKIKFYKKPGRKFWTYGRIEKFDPSKIVANIWIFDDKDETAIEIQGFQCRYIEGTRGLDENFLNNFLFKYQWRQVYDFVSPRDSTKYLPKPSQSLVEEVKKLVQTWPSEKRVKVIYEGEFTKDFEDLVCVFGCQYLEELGIAAVKGTTFKGKEVIESRGVQEIFHKLFYHVVLFLQERNILKSVGDDAWELVDLSFKKTEVEEINKLMDEFSEKFKDPFEYEMVLLKKCLPNLVGIITGKINAVELLFPSSEWDNIVQYYTQSASFGLYNKIANHSLKRLLEKLPENQSLNVLEIGAGTGGLTANILEVFPGDRTRYMFTDISKMFLDKASERFKEYKFMDFQLFDIEKEEHMKKFAPHSFDIIIASNVVHATADLEKTILNVKNLLAPGGYLVMLEVTNIKFPTYMDFVFGMTEGWWLYNDDIRGSHPSIPSAIWNRILVERLGFESVVELNFQDNDQQAVFIARNESFEVKEKGETEEKKRWLVFTDEENYVADYLKKLLPEDSTCYIKGDDTCSKATIGKKAATINPKNAKHMEELFKTHKKVEGIVYLWAVSDLAGKNHEFTYTNVEECFVRSNFGVINFMREVVNNDLSNSVTLVTNQCYNIEPSDKKVNVMASSMWGFGRVLLHENVTNLVQLIDLSSHKPGLAELENLGMYVLGVKKYEVEVALRGKLEYIHQLNHVNESKEIEENSVAVDATKDYFHSEVETLGVLDSTRLCVVDKPAVGADEVEINVRAAGMNFKDVMVGMKMLHEDAMVNGFTGGKLGMECTGVVTRVGGNVTQFKIGDEVCAISADSYSSFVVTPAAFVALKPEKLSFEEAATIPFAYLTAYYSLVNVGRIGPEDTVLLHSATGGVGIAAINICRWFKCKEIICTAGTDAKRKYLREVMKIKHVFNSRTLDYAKEIMGVCDGVDVILNSLAGPMIRKNIEILKPYGRFLELGKTDIYENNRITLKPFGNNLTYSAIDIDKLLTQRPRVCAEVITKFMKKVSEMTQLPLKTFHISNVREALMFMAGAKHLGKIVIKNEGKFSVQPPSKVSYKKDATYVIAGGTGGFGFEICKYLIKMGAGNVVIFSRSGVTDEYVVGEMKKIEGLANIKVYKGDVTNREQMAEIFGDIKKNLPPIKGVINSVLRLNDKWITKMDLPDLMVPIVPKCLGMQVLHDLSKDLDLDFTVVFTSIASSWGTLGQGNYAAANSFLEGYVRQLRLDGKRASSMAWGALGEVGYVKRTASVKKILNDQGWVPIVLAYSTEIFGFNTKNNTENITTIEAIWENLLKTTNSVENQKVRQSRRWENLFQNVKSGDKMGDGDGMNQILSIDDDEEKQNALYAVARVQVSKISGLKTEEIDIDEPIIFYGFDSLMTNQLRNWIQSNFGVEYSLLKIMKGISLRDLCNDILKMKEK